MNDRGSTCKFRNARNKQVELNPYIYTSSQLSRFGYEISVFKYTTGRYSEQPPEQPAHTSRMFLHEKMDVKIFLMFIVAENAGSVNITLRNRQDRGSTCRIKSLSLYFIQIVRFGYEISILKSQ